MIGTKLRYPGVQPFTEEQADLFFGRDDDCERLFNLILLEKLVVLFGKSGYGKSSLLNAGIRPKLLKETDRGKWRYFPVQVRFYTFNGQESLLDKFASEVLGKYGPKPNAPVIKGVPESLWSYLKFANIGVDITIVLLFDQFEEFFTYPEDQQQDFKRQLSELLYSDIPTYLKQNEDRHSLEELAFLREKIDVKAVCSIRSDRMSDLDRLKDKLPAILHKRCELRALSVDQAREALVEPARKFGPFASQAFEWSDDAIQRILHEFSRDKQGRQVGVEAFLLQVLALNIETQVIRGAIADRDGNGMPDVFPEDLPADLSNIFSEYYRNKIAELPEARRLPARQLIEEGLVFGGEQGEARRLSMDGDVLMRQFGADDELLRVLVNTFLLRREANTTGGSNYELSHDTLLKPILDGREIRRAEEQRKVERIEAEKAKQRALVLEAQAEEERRRAVEAERLREGAVKGRRRAWLFAWLAGGVAVLAIILGVFAFFKQQEAEAQKHIALENFRLAEEKTKEAELQKAAAEANLAEVERQKAILKAYYDQEIRVRQSIEKTRKEIKQSQKESENILRNLRKSN